MAYKKKEREREREKKRTKGIPVKRLMKDPVAPWDMDVMQGERERKRRRGEGVCYDIV